MQVRAKFICLDVAENGDGFNVTLQPVYTGSPENEEFFKLTPGGNITMSVVKPETAKLFEKGKEYYVDFTDAPVAEAAAPAAAAATDEAAGADTAAAE